MVIEAFDVHLLRCGDFTVAENSVISSSRQLDVFRSPATPFLKVEALDVVLEEGARPRPLGPAFSSGELPPFCCVPVVLDGILSPSGKTFCNFSPFVPH